MPCPRVVPSSIPAIPAKDQRRIAGQQRRPFQQIDPSCQCHFGISHTSLQDKHTKSGPCAAAEVPAGAEGVEQSLGEQVTSGRRSRHSRFIERVSPGEVLLVTIKQSTPDRQHVIHFQRAQNL